VLDLIQAPFLCFWLFKLEQMRAREKMLASRQAQRDEAAGDPGSTVVTPIGAPESLEAVIERARRQDAPLIVRQEAFAMLVERFQDAVYGYAYGLLGDPHLAQDAAQEAFLAAYSSLAQLRTASAFPGWLRRIVRTYCVRLRRGKESSLVQQGAPEMQRAHTKPGWLDSGVDPALVAEARELRATIGAALQALPERERTVTVLFYLSGYPQNEIAQFLDVPVTTVKKRLQSARKQLQERMLIMTHDALREGAREYLPSRDERFVETVRFLTAFEAAAAEGEVPLVELLLVDGLDVNVRDGAGRTLLSWAAQRGHPDAVELLLRHGADINIRDHAGKTALAWAVQAGHQPVVAVLRLHGGLR